jgi:hypothetical protein
MYRIHQLANLCLRDYGHRARIGKIETWSCTEMSNRHFGEIGLASIDAVRPKFVQYFLYD